MKDKLISKDLLSAVQKLVTSTRGKDINETLLTKLEPESIVIRDFFNITHFQSVVLATFIECGLRDKTVDTERLIDYFGKRMCVIADINEAIEELLERRFVFVNRQDFTCERKSDYNRNIRVQDRVLDAVMKGDSNLLDTPKVDSFVSLLSEARELIVKRMDAVLSTNELGTEIRLLLESNKSFPAVEWLLSQEGLNNYDLCLVLDVCIEHIEGAEEINLDKIIKEVFSDIQDRLRYKRQVKESKCTLILKDLIIFSDDMFSFMNFVKLSDTAQEMLLGGYQEMAVNVFHPKYSTLIMPEKITEEKLFYNATEGKQLETISRALENDNYNKLITRLKDKGMKGGLTILLSGVAGGGKTSSVMQWAKSTGRPVCFFEVSRIQSKFVGESEKQLQASFAEYAKCRKSFSKDAIFLFNEADAILGKRTEVNSAVDKSFNTLQNILLEAMENFEGIFVATTNLASHFDSAFERRFLYKVEFKSPETEVRKQILSNVFTDISESTINKINSDYLLTGGQIQNVHKKVLIKTVLDDQIDKESYIIDLCKEEFSLRKNQRSQIGFVH